MYILNLYITPTYARCIGQEKITVYSDDRAWFMVFLPACKERYVQALVSGLQTAQNTGFLNMEFALKCKVGITKL